MQAHDIIAAESTSEEGTMDREARCREYAERLRAEAARRFGAARAAALAQAIENAAGWSADVAAFPVDQEEPPAFYAEPAP
jgi:phage protein D